ncbi:MAG: MmcQ/YjbR family DNA-binding protein [Candidatus Solibacter sp.]
MDIAWIRKYCLSLPHTTETLQWGDNLVMKIGGKMYALVNTEPDEHWLAFKCSEEDFAELCEREGVVPAPYLARAHWVALEREDTIPRVELKRLVRKGYDLVFAGLTKKAQSALQVG